MTRTGTLQRSHAPKKTNPLVWFAAVICTVIAIAVIIAGIAVFAGYMIIHPRVPFITITSAHLDNLQYTVAGLLDTEITIVVRAENDNTKAHAMFSDTSIILSFQGLNIAKLVAYPFEVKKNSSVDFHYLVPSSSIPLSPQLMDQVDISLKRDKIIFNLKGNLRARWRVGPFGSVKFWGHLNCQLKFRPSNGTYIPSPCSSRAK